MKRTRTGQRGFSLMEATVVLAITSIVLLVVLRMVEQAASLSSYIESHNDLTVLTQRPLNQMQREVLQSRYIFGDDIGTDYLKNISSQVSSKFPIAPGSLLPAVDATGTISPDTTVRRTGNCLLVARALPPVSYTIAVDGNYPAVNFAADRYQFELFYLTRNTAKTFREGDRIVNLIRYRSGIFADYYQLVNGTVNMSTTQRQSLSKKLTDDKLATAWDPGEAFASAFWTIDKDLAFPTSGLQATPDLGLKDVNTIIPELVGGRVSGRMQYTIAYRTGTDKPGKAITGIPNRNLVPQFAKADTSLPLDCGFEVQIVGGSGARQVMTRLVMYSAYGVTRVDAQEAFVITSFTRA